MRKLFSKATGRCMNHWSFQEHTDWMACTRVWGSHIELQAASSFFEMPVFLCNTSQSGHQGYKWNCYKLFTPVKKTSGNKTMKLVYPPPQEKLKTLDLLCHTGVYHFACHSNDLKFSLITCISLHCCVIFIGASLSECCECLHCLFYIYMYGTSVVL